jgi:hypothetical protein
MKQKIYIFGVVTSLIAFIGIIFKVNHFPGAGILMTVGLLLLVWLFLPLALINNYKAEGNKQNLSLYIITWLTCFVIFTSMLFKIMHWPYAGLMLTIALPFPYIVFLPAFLIVTGKNPNFNIYNTVFVLLLLALNSVFAALLALNVSKDRIVDSYNLSGNYNKLETYLSKLPDTAPASAINTKIDAAIKIIDEYQDIILKEDGISRDEWIINPRSLYFPDSRQLATNALLRAEGSRNGTRLEEALKAVVQEMKRTPGYAGLADAAPKILNLEAPEGWDPDWSSRNFSGTNLSWILINLDGLRTNLLMIKSSGY